MSTPPKSISPWKKFRYRLEWAACSSFSWMVQRLSRRVCIRLAYTLGAVAYFFDKRGRQIALANLACVFPEKSESERNTIARLSYQNFARTMADLFWSPRLTPENWRQYIELEGDVDGFVKQAAQQSFVVLCVHWGNFEWVNQTLGFLDTKMVVVAETFKNKSLTTIFQNARQASGNQLIEQENSMIRLLKAVKRGAGTGMLVDLTLQPDQAAVPIRAFGRTMCVTFLHAVLAQRGGARLIPMKADPLPDGRCRITFSPELKFPPEATPQEIAQACWDHFEPIVRARPEMYLWSYKHLRYRPEAAAPEDYPYYASVSPSFEVLLANAATAGIKKPSTPAPGDLTNPPA